MRFFEDFLLPLIGHPFASWIMAGAIVCTGFLSAVYWHQHVRRLRKEVRSLLGGLEKPEQIPSAQTLDQLTAQIESVAGLKSVWLVYSGELDVPDPFIDPDGRIHSHQSAHRVFSPMLLESRLNVKLFQAMPNFLVGAGLLCTFLGLIAALYYASAGVAAPDVKEAQRALRDLLHAATFKFITSVVGLLTSIIFSIFEKRLLHDIYAQLALLADELDKRFPVLTIERMLLQQQRNLDKWSRRSQDNADEQLGQLKYFNTDLATQLASAMERQLKPRIDEATGAMTSAIDGLGSRFLQLNEGAMSQTVQQFGASLKANAGEEMEQFRSMLGQLSDSLADNASNLQHQQLQMLTQFQQAVSSLEGGFQRGGLQLSQNLEHSTRQTEKAMDEMLDRLKGSVVALEQGLQQTGQLFASQLQGSAHQSSQLIETMMSRLELGLTGLEQGLSRSGSSFAQNMEASTQRSSEQLAGVAQQFGGAVSQLSGTLGGFKTLLESADQHSKSHLQAMRTNQESLKVIHSELNQTLTRLGSTGQPLLQTSQTLQRSLEQLGSQQRLSEQNFKAFSEGASRTLEALKLSQQSLEQVSKRVETTWITYQTRFEGVDKDLERAFGELQRGLHGYTNSATTFLDKLDTNLTKAVSSLNAPVQELAEAVEELQKTLPNMRTSP